MTLTFTIESMRGKVRFRIPDVHDYAIKPDDTLDLTMGGLFGTEDGKGETWMFWDQIYKNVTNVVEISGEIGRAMHPMARSFPT